MGMTKMREEEEVKAEQVAKELLNDDESKELRDEINKFANYLSEKKLADDGIWKIVEDHYQAIHKQKEHFERKDMNVLLVAENLVLGQGIGNMFNLFRAYEALTSPGRPKLKSVIPILRVTKGGGEMAESMGEDFKKKVKSEMDKATNNAITKEEGFCDFDGKLVPWMKRFFTQEDLTPHLVIYLSGMGGSGNREELTEQIESVQHTFNDKLQNLITAMREEKKDEAERAWESKKLEDKKVAWRGSRGDSGYRKRKKNLWDVAKDLEWKEKNKDKWEVEEGTQGEALNKDEYLAELRKGIENEEWKKPNFNKWYINEDEGNVPDE